MPPSSIGAVSFTTLPAYVSMNLGDSTDAQLGFYNSGNYNVSVTVSSSRSKDVAVAPSAGVISLGPKESKSIQLDITSMKTNDSAYLVPTNITVTASNATRTSVFINRIYTILVLNNPENSSPTYDTKIYLSTFNKTAIAQITLNNPSNRTSYNTQLSDTLLLPNLASARQIAAVGLASNITGANGTYSVNWNVPRLDPHQSVLLGYSLSNVTLASGIFTPSTLITSSFENVSSVLSLLSFTLPRAYTNRTNNTLAVHTSYAGASPANVTYVLTPASAPGGAPPYVINSYQEFTELPNTIKDVVFRLGNTTAPGNYLYGLAIAGPFPGHTYPVWVNITATPPSPARPQPSYVYPFYAFASAALIAYAAALVVLRRRASKAKKTKPAPRRKPAARPARKR